MNSGEGGTNIQKILDQRNRCLALSFNLCSWAPLVTEEEIQFCSSISITIIALKNVVSQVDGKPPLANRLWEGAGNTWKLEAYTKQSQLF